MSAQPVQELNVRAAARRRSEGGGPPAAEAIRGLSHDARVVLALKEAELARSGVQLRKLVRKGKRQRQASESST